jgi:hypothetical protein
MRAHIPTLSCSVDGFTRSAAAARGNTLGAAARGDGEGTALGFTGGDGAGIAVGTVTLTTPSGIALGHATTPVPEPLCARAPTDEATTVAASTITALTLRARTPQLVP